MRSILTLFVASLFVASLCTFCSQALAADATAPRPNILFIMADDIGWGDFQCYNPDGKVPSPNIDRLAREGMRFTDAHTPAALCAPTRYTVATGNYTWRGRAPAVRGAGTRRLNSCPAKRPSATCCRQPAIARHCLASSTLAANSSRSPAGNRTSRNR